jgi:hypothetical protein
LLDVVGCAAGVHVFRFGEFGHVAVHVGA